MPNGTSSHAVSLAIVVILNWIISHLDNPWVMPPEVQSALQTIIGVAWMYWAVKKQPNGSSDEPAAALPQQPAPPAGVPHA